MNNSIGKHFLIHFPGLPHICGRDVVIRLVNGGSVKLTFEVIVGKTKRGRRVVPPIRYSPARVDLDSAPEDERVPIARGKRNVANREQENKPDEDFRKTADKYIEANKRIRVNEERCQIELHHAKLKATRDEANLKDLQVENKRLQGDLEAYKKKAIESTEANDLLKVDILKQQPASQLPDSEVVKMYEQLGEAISSWVDDEVAISNDMWRKRNDCYPGTNQFQDTGIPHYRQFLDEGFRFGGEYLLESLIQQELHEELFGERMMFFGLDYQENMFVSKVEEGLSKLEPPRSAYYYDRK
ncbi:MAG: hypothetical protein LQ341_002197 [Variospora aurantia]|nr:MAG: hypothetical protein LQ341_002197 [Variospora aurantia]